MKSNHVRCTYCKYVRPDASASDEKWTALECGNSQSEYHRCLLNVSENGKKLRWIAQAGCKNGMLSEAREAI